MGQFRKGPKNPIPPWDRKPPAPEPPGEWDDLALKMVMDGFAPSAPPSVKIKLDGDAIAREMERARSMLPAPPDPSRDAERLRGMMNTVRPIPPPRPPAPTVPSKDQRRLETRYAPRPVERDRPSKVWSALLILAGLMSAAGAAITIWQAMP